MQKRYQYYSREGIAWTPWFKVRTETKEKYQLKGKLLNEYKED